jgi:hypothetical protein
VVCFIDGLLRHGRLNLEGMFASGATKYRVRLFKDFVGKSISGLTTGTANDHKSFLQESLGMKKEENQDDFRRICEKFKVSSLTCWAGRVNAE